MPLATWPFPVYLTSVIPNPLLPQPPWLLLISADTQGLYTYCSLSLKYSLFTYHISTSRSFPLGRLSWLYIRTDSWF